MMEIADYLEGTMPRHTGIVSEIRVERRGGEFSPSTESQNPLNAFNYFFYSHRFGDEITAGDDAFVFFFRRGG